MESTEKDEMRILSGENIVVSFTLGSYTGPNGLNIKVELGKGV